MSRLAGTYIDPTGEAAFAGRYLSPQGFEEGVARVSSPRDGRMGLIDDSGRSLTGERYDFIEPLVEGIARVNAGGWLEQGTVKGGKWGYISAAGGVIVEPCWDMALDVSEDRLTVALEGKYGFLDREGRVVVAPRWDFALWHQDGLAVVALEGGDGYVDRDGKVVIGPRFQEGTAFASGMARVKVGDRWGIIDTRGEMLHEAIYERLGQVKAGACWAVRDGRCCVLTREGTILGDEWFEEIRQAAQDGTWPVRRGVQWGFLRADGRLVAMEYESTLAFGGGLGRVQRDGKWGFVDSDGELVLPCRFEDAWNFEEDRVAVRLEAGWTFVDRDGREIGPGGFAAATFFRGGLAAVQSDDRWGYLDTEGGLAIAPRFDWVGHFAGGLAPVLSAERAGFVVAEAPESVHVLPAGGLRHPLFEGMGPAAHLIAIIGFARDLTDPEHTHLGKLVEAWERCVHPAGKLYTEDKWVSGANMYLRVQNLADPRTDVALLMDEIGEAGFPVQETLFARWGTPPGEKVMQPNADPRMGGNFQAVFEDLDEYWETIWNAEGPAPAPENYFYLRGALQTEKGLCLEERHMPVWFPDVKICMGALQGQGEQYLPAGDASERVEAALATAIEERFAKVWIKPGIERFAPQAMVRSGEPGVERLRYAGRTGYGFAFECSDLHHWFSPSRMRYREPELMEALRKVVLELGLAPVILWQRFQQPIPMLPMGTPTVLVVNLFDP